MINHIKSTCLVGQNPTRDHCTPANKIQPTKLSKQPTESPQATSKISKETNPSSQAEKTLSTFKSTIAKVKSAPIIKQIDQAKNVMQAISKKIYTKLAERYGKPTAIACIAAGQAADWGSVALGASLGIPLYIPGASILGMLPIRSFILPERSRISMTSTRRRCPCQLA